MAVAVSLNSCDCNLVARPRSEHFLLFCRKPRDQHIAVPLPPRHKSTGEFATVRGWGDTIPVGMDQWPEGEHNTYERSGPIPTGSELVVKVGVANK